MQSLYSIGVESDDARLTDRHVWNKLVSTRALIIKRALDKRQQLSEWNYTTFNCVKLVKAAAHECPCLPPKGCSVWKSSYALPKPLMGKYTDTISWVMGILNQGEQTIFLTQETQDSMRHVESNKYTANKPRYVIENNFLYVYGMAMSSQIDEIYVRLRMLVEDPTESTALLYDCNDVADCSNGNCPECQDVRELEFPLDEDKAEMVITMALDELFRLFSASTQDYRNNDIDDKAPQNVKTNRDGGQ